jgi:hypothetical protein
MAFWLYIVFTQFYTSEFLLVLLGLDLSAHEIFPLKFCDCNTLLEVLVQRRGIR